MCKDVRFFETWNALINRLDEINVKVLYSLNSENYQKKLPTRQLFLTKRKTVKQKEDCLFSHKYRQFLFLVWSPRRFPIRYSICTQWTFLKHSANLNCFTLFLINIQCLSWGKRWVILETYSLIYMYSKFWMLTTSFILKV